MPTLQLLYGIIVRYMQELGFSVFNTTYGLSPNNQIRFRRRVLIAVDNGARSYGIITPGRDLKWKQHLT